MSCIIGGVRGDVPLLPHCLRRAEEPDGGGLCGARGADLPLPLWGAAAGPGHCQRGQHRLPGGGAFPLHPHLHRLRAGTHFEGYAAPHVP